MPRVNFFVRPLIANLLTISIALVWLINGLVCKLLSFVPRHQQIVSRILGEDLSTIGTKVIGMLELLMAIWILSGIRSRLCAVIQIMVVAAMNIIEFISVPDLLLFGRVNILISILFVLTVYINTFIMAETPFKKHNPGQACRS